MTIVIVLHGLNASPQWGFFPAIATRLAGAGLGAMRIAIPSQFVDVSVDYIHNQLKSFSGCRVFFLGHSRGAAIAQIVAAQRNNPTEKVVAWSSIGSWTIRNRSRGALSSGASLDNNKVYSIPHSAATLQKRILYIHAKGDLVVREQVIVTLATVSGNADSLLLLPGSTHTFGIKHPMVQTTGTFESVTKSTIEFLLQP